MEPGVAPDWVVQLLPIVLWAAIAAGALWLVLRILDYANRRAYNLTMADRGGKGADPGFLSVDHDKRAAAQTAGDAFDAKIAARDAAEAAGDAPPPATSAKTSISKLVTLALGAVTAISVVVGAVGRIEVYDDAVRRLTSWERLSEIVATHWVGFVVAALIIVAHVVQTARQSGSGKS